MPSARAVRIQAPGGPEVLQLATLEVPEPGPSEVLVEIKAAGLNRADLMQRKGVYPAPHGVPADVPGLEFAGVVAAVGAAVRSWNVGDRVMAIAGGGTMATHIVMHERELLPIPENLSFTDAAAIPEVFMTAYDAMLLQGCLGMGQQVLIHAAGSGVGTAAIQLARAVGAVPIGTSRKADKLERAKQFGLEHGIVTREPVFADRVLELTRKRGVDLVLDTVGAKYLAENLRAIATSGTIVTIGLVGGVKAELVLGLLVQKRACLRGSVLRSRPLEEKIALAQRFASAVLPLFASGELRPVVEAVLPMADIQKAHARLEADDTFGKLVLAW